MNTTRNHPPGIARVKRIQIYYTRDGIAHKPSIKTSALPTYTALQRQGRIQNLQLLGSTGRNGEQL